MSTELVALDLRPGPLGVVRESIRAIRRRWLELTVATTVSVVVISGVELITNSLQSVGLDFRRLALHFVYYWLVDLRWMAIALIVAGSLVNGKGEGVTIVRRFIAIIPRTISLSLILFLARTAVRWSIVNLSSSVALRIMKHSAGMGYWLLQRSDRPAPVITAAIMAPVAFAPLALALENASVGFALPVSFDRIFRNWIWVCLMAVVLGVPYIVLVALGLLLPHAAFHTYPWVALYSVARTFFLVGMSVAYLHLAARARAKNGAWEQHLRPAVQETTTRT